MSIVRVDPVKLQAIQNASRIAELKKLLADTDYKVLPDYDKPDPNIAVLREQWRTEIRALESTQ